MAKLSSLTPMSLVLACLLGVVSLSAAETINLSASKTTGVAIDETVTVSLVLSGGAPLQALQGYLEWDKALLQLSAEPSTTLTDAGGATFSANNFDLVAARAAGAGRRSYFNTSGEVSRPTATLMTWTFKALAAGTAVVQTRQAAVGQEFPKLANAAGVTRYPAVGPSLSIAIISTPIIHPGDTNGDLVVNIFDLINVKRALGTSTGDPDYSVTVDFNSDGVVNIQDLITVKSLLGTSY